MRDRFRSSLNIVRRFGGSTVLYGGTDPLNERSYIDLAYHSNYEAEDSCPYDVEFLKLEYYPLLYI